MSSRNFNLAQAGNIGVTVLPDLTTLPTVSQALTVRQITAGNVETGFVTLTGNNWSAVPVTAIGPSLLNTSGTLDVANSIVTSAINGAAAAPGSGSNGSDLTLLPGLGDGSGGAGSIYLGMSSGPAPVISLAHTQVGSFATTRFLSMVSPTGQSRTFRFMTATASSATSRWQITANATAEGGSNAGCDLDITSMTDAGGFLTNPLIRITRATGVTTHNAPLAATFIASGVSNNIVPTGTTQATARALIQGLNLLSGVTAGSNGAALPAIGAVTVVGAVPVGAHVDIFNTGSVAARIYGNGTQTIDAAAAATGVPLSGGNRCRYFANTGSTWVSALMGTASA